MQRARDSGRLRGADQTGKCESRGVSGQGSRRKKGSFGTAEMRWPQTMRLRIFNAQRARIPNIR